MNITYISVSPIPSRQASSIQIVNMCEAFAQNGHDVVLLTPANAESTVEDIHQYYGVDPIFEIRRLPWYPLKGYQYSVLAALSAYRRGSDLVYSRSIAGCYFGAKMGLDVVYESHSPADRLHPITDRLFTSLLTHPRFVRLVVISEALHDYYASKYDLEGRIRIAHDAAELDDPKPIPEIESRDGFQAGYVGQLYEGKGVYFLEDLARDRPDVTFHVVGGNQDDVEMWKTRTGDLSNMIFHGFVEPGRVGDYLVSFDALLAPYRRRVLGASGKTDLSKWMSPLKLFEYMAAERPIVCSDLAVLREILTDEETALLCAPGDVDEWSEAISQLADNPAQAAEMATRARQSYESAHTYRARAERVLSGIDRHRAET